MLYNISFGFSCLRVCTRQMLLCALFSAGFASVLPADTVRTQRLSLQEGWNAVFLEVDPIESSPSAIFGDSPVDIVARYLRSAATFQFVDNPEVDVLGNAGWHVWYGDDRPDSFLSNLFAINGPTPLLVHARSEAEVEVRGGVVVPLAEWQPNAFNFVGAGLVKGEEPTFAQYFAGSPAHQHNRIYRMVNDGWRQVLDPAVTPMRSGEAFWIYTEGASTYQGPVGLKVPTTDGLLLATERQEFQLFNRLEHPLSISVGHRVAGPNPVPLAVVIRVLGDPDDPLRWEPVPQPDGDWNLALSPFEAGEGRAIPLQARLEEMETSLHSSLLYIRSDLGTECYVPVIAVREDLIPSE